ncbi:hypothetical protein [Streptomyces sp. NPDC020298]|uniref:hypothetical protein n=1 Tax=unclassified Streptomyces TaxID=2593676 RepID=UPI0033F93008
MTELPSPVVVVVEAAVVTVVTVVAIVTVIAVVSVIAAVVSVVSAVVTMVSAMVAVVAAVVVMDSAHRRGRRGDGRRSRTSQGQGETRKGSNEPFDVAHDVSPEMDWT